MNMTVTLYEQSKWKSEHRRLGRATLDQNEVVRIRNLRIEVIRNAKGWFNSDADIRKPMEHRLKVEVLANNHPLSYFNVFAGAPELDIDYYDSPSQECNPRIECCLVPHYVNFTEIGWNKFIMYPAGFYANYCIGPKHVSCPHEDPEVESILSTARVQSSLPLTRYKCAPRTFAPLNILYSVGPNHSMKLRLDDVRALSCSCMN
ncbi:hypothetical protein Y032_0228g2877 [Ancylostoma ceylanicum]|uniref:TGF-beta family profile domain-containing protein n=2 Tax=Ancylostoma ceylanicum TaxID=53326 RepID=A0A016SH74_9BILA|nr:hypothetical protein Y032_0228g2877 [Ancylostoma ceylanicum]